MNCVPCGRPLTLRPCVLTPPLQILFQFDANQQLCSTMSEQVHDPKTNCQCRPTCIVTSCADPPGACIPCSNQYAGLAESVHYMQCSSLSSGVFAPRATSTMRKSFILQVNIVDRWLTLMTQHGNTCRGLGEPHVFPIPLGFQARRNGEHAP